MKKNSLLSILLVFVFFTSSCTQLQEIGFRSYKNTFSSQLDNQTKEQKLYRDFETVAIANVTYFDKNLAQLYYDYLMQRNTVSDNNKNIYEKFVNEAKSNYVFWISLYASDYDTNNIAEKKSFWNVYVDCNGKKIYPIKIEKVSKDNPLAAWIYLKKRQYWSKDYIVEFKRECASSPLYFNMSSIAGSLNFEF